MININTADGCIHRLKQLLPDIKVTGNSTEDVVRLSGDYVGKKAAIDGVPIQYIKFTDFLFPGSHMDFVSEYFCDDLRFSLMFPEVFRKHISGRVYIWNLTNGFKRTEPYLVEWSEITQFVSDYKERGGLFNGDVFFVFEDHDMISFAHHEGVFCHLYIGKSLAKGKTTEEWFAEEDR